jgi:hypothetical protein
MRAHSVGQVEDVLYQVPRSLLLASPVFQQVFTLPPAGTVDGQSTRQPLRLGGVTAGEFTLFVRAALAQYVGHRRAGLITSADRGPDKRVRFPS